MGGAITIESEQGKGTTVHITTVHRMAPTFDGTESANTLKKMTKSLKGVRILLAEDNPLNAEIAIEVLRGAGVEVDTVGDGEDCVKAVTEKSAGYYAAVLMDIQMPRMDEYAATKLIRAFADLRKKTNSGDCHDRERLCRRSAKGDGLRHGCVPRKTPQLNADIEDLGRRD